MKSLMLFCLSLFFVVFGAVADTYRVNTRSMLNMRSGPSPSYGVVTQLAPGSYVTMIDESGGKWVIVEQNGKQGYVMKKYIVYAGSGSSSTGYVQDEKENNLLSGHNEWLLWTVLCLFAILLMINFDWLDWAPLTMLSIVLFPSSIIAYCLFTDNAMWYCSPSKVGWVMTILNVFVTMLVLSMCWGNFKGFFREMFRDFGFFNLLLALLFGAAVFFIVKTAIMELFIAAIVMIIGAAGGSSKIGTFTDNDGNVYDVYDK